MTSAVPRRWAAAFIVAGGLAVLAVPAVRAGDIRLLAQTSRLSPELLVRFERDTGISVRLTEVATSAELIARLEGGESGADIVFPPDDRVGDLIGRGLLERIWADRLPGYWNIEDPWRSRPSDPRDEYTIPHQWGTISFAVDTLVHKGDIDSLSLLFSPSADLVGRIAIVDDALMVQLALLQAGEPRCTVDPTRLGRAVTLLAPLVARARLVAADRLAEALRDDRLALVVAWSGDVLRAREDRPSLAFAYPREGNLVWSNVVAVPVHSPNRGAALTFLAFMLRPENAALQANHNGFATMIQGAEAAMRPDRLAAPEMVAPWPAKVSFLTACGGEAQRRHREVWAKVRKSVR